MNRIALLLPALLLFGFGGISQNFIQTNYTTEDGLPSNEAYSVIQDTKGYIWVSTDRGIAKFNGSSFKTFGHPQGLKSSVIYKLLALNNGSIAFMGADNKVGIIKNDSVRYVEIDEITEPSSIFKCESGFAVGFLGEAKYIVFNDHGQEIEKKLLPKGFYIKTLPGDFTIHMGNPLFQEYKRVLILNNDKELEIPFIAHSIHKNINSTVVDDQVIITNSRNLAVINEKEGIKLYSLPSISTGSALIKSDGEIWIGLFDNGIQPFNLQTGKLSDVILKDFSVSGIIEDNNGNYWISSLNKGLLKLQTSYYESLTRTQVSKVIIIKDSLIASYKNKGLYAYDIKKAHGENFLNSIHLMDLFEFQEKFIGSRMKASQGEQIKTDIPKNINLIFASGRSAAWDRNLVSVLYTVLYLADPATYNYSVMTEVKNLEPGYTYFTQVFEDTLYVGRPKGLYQIWTADGEYQAKKVFDKPVTSAIRQKKGYLLGTKGQGLYAVDKGFNILWNQTNTEGLSGNFISSMVYSGDTLILGTNNGVSLLVNKQSKGFSKILHSGISEGLASKSVTSIAVSGAKLFVASEAGLQSTNLSLVNSKLTNPKPIINLINGVGSYTDETHIIPKGTKNISITTSTIFYYEGQAYLKEYRLLGLDSLWKSFSSNEIEFSNIPPGKYEFQFRTKLPKNSVYTLTSKPLILPPTFLQTLWFKALVLLLIIMIIIGFYTFRLRRLKFVNDSLVKQERLKFRALTSQLNPHFMFNALGNIQNLIITDQNNIAAEYLARFSNLLDRTLKNTNELFIPLYDELDFIDQYIEVEKSRFEKSFLFEWKIDSTINVAQTLVPTMFLQPYIENSILHGIKHKKGKGIIQVQIVKLDNKKLEVVIQDNGIGIVASKKIRSERTRKSLAMSNLNTRLDIMSKLFKEAFTYSAKEITDLKGNVSGTEIKIVIPYK
ncbi:MAG: histidine kinase, partial [Salibacteraceae bacterium]